MLATDKTKSFILVKSEKISQKKKKRLVWIVTVVVIITTFVSFVVDYSGYRKGQKYGLAIATSEIAGANWVDKNDSYAKQCKDVYYKLNRRSQDIYIYGKKIDASDVRRAEEAVRSSFYKIMESAGFHRYSESNIANWFKYTNFVEYYFGHFGGVPISLICYIIVIAALVYALFVNMEEKKEIVVYNNSVLCRISPKKSKQLVFDDINNVDFGKKTLKLVGVGVKFKISNLTNAEEIKTVIIDMKNNAQNVADGTISSGPASSADELKKYKELLDIGVITQEEFDSKKKQILQN